VNCIHFVVAVRSTVILIVAHLDTSRKPATILSLKCTRFLVLPSENRGKISAVKIDKNEKKKLRKNRDAHFSKHMFVKQLVISSKKPQNIRIILAVVLLFIYLCYPVHVL